MKKLYSLFLSAAVMFLAAGCSSDNGDDPIVPEITITTSSFTLGYEEGSEAVAEFGINVDWTATVSYEGEQKNWLNITPIRGAAGDAIKLTMRAKHNPTLGERTAYVTIGYGDDQTHKLTVVQGIDGDVDITAAFDPKFAVMLEQKGYIPDADKIVVADVKDITNVDIFNRYNEKGRLTSLAGIEYFSSLQSLNCGYNRLTSLDISKNIHLVGLYCSGNQLTSLDISNNMALGYLHCDTNQLTSLDISQHTELVEFSCYSNLLTSLDISQHTNLTILYCESNQLTSLDVSNNADLIRLYCSGNQLSSLDISKNTKLVNLYCSHNQLMSLDVSKNTKLVDLYCGYNQLMSLDISKNKRLINMACSHNPGEEAVFAVDAWFDNDAVPEDFTTDGWDYDDDNYITIDYRKVTAR